jgi:hypothetical protein
MIKTLGQSGIRTPVTGMRDEESESDVITSYTNRPWMLSGEGLIVCYDSGANLSIRVMVTDPGL